MRLLVTSGRGPAECRIAVQKVVKLIQKDAASHDFVSHVVEGPTHSQGHGPASVVVVLDADDAVVVAKDWIGTVQWIAQSPIRPNHKRKNWFVSVSHLEDPSLLPALDEGHVRLDYFRASGPGGQHVNKTSTAVRALHIPTGLVATSQDQRSQHQNRKIALERLQLMLNLRDEMAKGAVQAEAQRRHDALERGNPIRVIR